MKSVAIARRLRRDQTEEEKQLWRALRAGRFAGFKFRRQHPQGKYILDFYFLTAQLSMELDGFQHGRSELIRRDEVRARFLAAGASRNCGFGIINGGKSGRGPPGHLDSAAPSDGFMKVMRGRSGTTASCRQTRNI